MENKKKHADFQDEYRKSSNFGKTDSNNEEDLKIKGDGELKLKKDEKMKAKSEDKAISKTLNKISSEEE